MTGFKTIKQIIYTDTDEDDTVFEMDTEYGEPEITITPETHVITFKNKADVAKFCDVLIDFAQKHLID